MSKQTEREKTPESKPLNDEKAPTPIDEPEINQDNDDEDDDDEQNNNEKEDEEVQSQL